MGMMKIIGNVGRKFRTAVMKKTRPKTIGNMGKVKPQYRMEADWETEGLPAEAYVKKAVSSKPTRVSFKGQDMQERNFMKSFRTVGGYKYGTIVPKASVRSQGVSKSVRDASAFEGGTKRNWAKNYKTRSYQP